MIRMIFSFLILFSITDCAYAYDQLTEVDPVVLNSHFNSRKWEYEFELDGSPWLMDSIKKVKYQRKNGKKFKTYCWTTARSKDFHCTLKTKMDYSKIKVLIERKGKLQDIEVYFEANMIDIEYLGSFPEWKELSCERKRIRNIKIF